MIRLVAFDLDGTIGDTIPLCLAAFREATTPYVDHELSDEEKDILDVVIEKLGKMSKNEIINFMHKEQAYVETVPRDIIQFKYAESLQI